MCQMSHKMLLFHPDGLVFTSCIHFVTASFTSAATCSFGVSEYRHGETSGDLLKRADLALFAAKRGGRNRIVSETALTAADLNPAPAIRADHRLIA